MASGADKQRTWNSPEQIARHRAMTKQERFAMCVDLSRAALRLAASQRAELDQLRGNDR
jgi:hypothetical protein